MIYEAVSPGEPIRQGDIFRDIPRVDLSLRRLAVVEDDDPIETSWAELLAETDSSTPVTAVLPIKRVRGIVITQNCDAVRGEYLALCQLDRFSEVAGDPPKTAKKWQRKIVQHSRTTLRYFYLPVDSGLGIAERMAADFRVVIRLQREDLEESRDLRICRLNQVGTEHFRETLGQFFRRYPYDEWYPLDQEEFAEYQSECPEPVQPFPWQK